MALNEQLYSFTDEHTMPPRGMGTRMPTLIAGDGDCFFASILRVMGNSLGLDNDNVDVSPRKTYSAPLESIQQLRLQTSTVLRGHWPNWFATAGISAPDADEAAEVFADCEGLGKYVDAPHIKAAACALRVTIACQYMTADLVPRYILYYPDPDWFYWEYDYPISFYQDVSREEFYLFLSTGQAPPAPDSAQPVLTLGDRGTPRVIVLCQSGSRYLSHFDVFDHVLQLPPPPTAPPPAAPAPVAAPAGAAGAAMDISGNEAEEDISPLLGQRVKVAVGHIKHRGAAGAPTRYLPDYFCPDSDSERLWKQASDVQKKAIVDAWETHKKVVIQKLPRSNGRPRKQLSAGPGARETNQRVMCWHITPNLLFRAGPSPAAAARLASMPAVQAAGATAPGTGWLARAAENTTVKSLASYYERRFTPKPASAAAAAPSSAVAAPSAAAAAPSSAAAAPTAAGAAAPSAAAAAPAGVRNTAGSDANDVDGVDTDDDEADYVEAVEDEFSKSKDKRRSPVARASPAQQRFNNQCLRKFLENGQSLFHPDPLKFVRPHQFGGRNLDQYYTTSCAVWDPHYEPGVDKRNQRGGVGRNGLPSTPCCPNCKTRNNVQRNGWQTKGAQRVIGLDRCTYVWIRKYRCVNCSGPLNSKDQPGVRGGKNFNFQANHDAVLDELRSTGFGYLVKDLGIEFSHKLAVSTQVLDMVVASWTKSISMDGLADVLNELHTNRWLRLGIQYTECVSKWSSTPDIRDLLSPTPTVEVPPPFSEFGSTAGYNGKVITGDYLRALGLRSYKERKPMLTIRMMMTELWFGRSDHTFKTPKAIVGKGMTSAFTCMNGWGEIVFFGFFRQKSPYEWIECLRRVALRPFFWRARARDVISACDKSVANTDTSHPPGGDVASPSAQPGPQVGAAPQSAGVATSSKSLGARAWALFNFSPSRTATASLAADSTATEARRVPQRPSPARPLNWLAWALDFGRASKNHAYHCTDSCCADRVHLVTAHPALGEGVTVKSSSVPLLDLPPRSYVDQPGLVSLACTALSSCSVIGLDAEWNAGKKGATPGPVSILMLSSPLMVYIFDLRALVKTPGKSPFPVELKDLLLDGSVLKVGRCVKGDFDKLCDNYKIDLASRTPAQCGVVDIISVVRPRWQSVCIGGSLDSLTESVLGFKLDKSSNLTMSDWNHRPLSDPQLEYAARDAMASLKVYMAAVDPDHQLPRAGDTNAETAAMSQYIGRNVTWMARLRPTSAVEPWDGVVTGYDSTDELFTVLFDDGQSQLFNLANLNQILVPIEDVMDVDGEEEGTPEATAAAEASPTLGKRIKRSFRQMLSFPLVSSLLPSRMTQPLGDAAAATADAGTADAGTRIGPEAVTGTGAVSANGTGNGHGADTGNVTGDGAAAGAAGNAAQSNTAPSREPFQRVCQDIFHVFMGRYEHGCTSKVDPAYKAFRQMLRHAFYIEDETDRRFAEQYLITVRGLTPQQVREWPAHWFRKHVKRLVPPPSILAQRVQLVYNSFQDWRKQDGELLFRQGNGKDAMAKVHADVMTHIQHGCMSDPPGVCMYYVVHRTKEGLPTYRCLRSSSQLEGFHLHLRKIFDSWNVSPLVADSIVCLFIHSWNITAGIRSRGFPNRRTSRTELMDEMQCIHHKVHSDLFFPEYIVTPAVPPEELEHFGHEAARGQFDDVTAAIDDAMSELRAAEERQDEEVVVAQLVNLQKAGVPLESLDGDEDLAVGGPASLKDLGSLCAAVKASVPKPPPAAPPAARRSTAIPVAAQQYADAVGLPYPVAPIETEEEVKLFWELLPRFVSKTGKAVNYESLTAEFNKEVTRRLHAEPGLANRLRLKTASAAPVYADAVHAREQVLLFNAGHLDVLVAAYKDLKQPVVAFEEGLEIWTEFNKVTSYNSRTNDDGEAGDVLFHGGHHAEQLASLPTTHSEGTHTAKKRRLFLEALSLLQPAFSKKTTGAPVLAKYKELVERERAAGCDYALKGQLTIKRDAMNKRVTAEQLLLSKV